jgi:hypothetical protein
LHTLRADRTGRLGELPAVFALDAVKQSGPVAPGALAYFRPGEATRDPLMHRVQCL